MLLKIKGITLLLLFISIFSFGQINADRKKIEATRIENPPKIDGKVDDEAWKNIPIAKDFVMMQPDNGATENETYKTEVKLVYDDDAVYVSAVMYTPDASKVPKEFKERDQIGNSDFFMILLNPNDDGQNPFMFMVTASGIQVDAKVSRNNEDYNWNAVWESGIHFNEKSWTVEMKIPYRAIRFANEPVQSWGVNFHREIKNINARYTWNFIDNNKGQWTQYDGLAENFKNIKPPTRLSFYPYASGTVNMYDGETLSDWSVGMDVKYGLTENFTLDATLIPDFGQTAFDNVTLNLGPFEQQFSEQRQFFTEGTELFSKGRLFYSRRIGGSPTDQFDVSSQLKENEEITESPSKVDLLNAIKVSGRTKGGLGIGFFNAITDKTEAIITNTDTKETRKLTTNPLANYNILVLDQQFNKNSAVTLINTNVTRNGRFRDANSTGLLYHVETKDSKYNIDGSVKMTNISDDITQPNTGYAFDTSIGKNSGNWRGEIGYNMENKDYNPNDLGILFSNNQQGLYGYVSYETLKPKGKFNSYSFASYYNINFLHHSGVYTGSEISLSARAHTKKRFAFGGNLNYRSTRKDFFEPRQGSTSGVYFERPLSVNINQWISTDYRKKLAFDYFIYYTTYKNNPKNSYGFSISPRYRFNNYFSLIYELEYNKINNDQGYVTEDNDDIIFGERNRTSYSNSLRGKYAFNTKSSLSLTFRHNWSKVPYDAQYYKLLSNGLLTTSAYSEFNNINFNSWNLDLNYVWQFAPGSQIIAFYRNSIANYTSDEISDLSFKDNLDKLFEEPNQHTFSLRFVYFIDYSDIKNIF